MPAEVAIGIDVREPRLQSLLQSYYENEEDPSIRDSISLSVLSLNVGDVEIRFGSTCILLERKSCADMAASLKDGRYSEQKVRLLSRSPPQHVIYVLEGVPSQQTLLSTDFPVHGLKPSVLSSMIVHTMLRDGIHVVSVPSTQETAAWVWTIARKCASHPEKISGGSVEGQDYLQHVKTKKMDNVTPENCYVMQLCQIPSISVSTAREIVKRYPTMLSLLTALSRLPDTPSRVKCLSEIPMIGKKKALVILEYLLPEDDPSNKSI